MKALVTGLNGTVAPVLARVLADEGHTVVGWDRAVIPTDDPEAARAFLGREQPDAVFHLATGSPDWAALVAGLSAESDIAFLFTSSVSVFAASQRGPHTVEATPTPEDDYGRYKLACEQVVRAAHPGAHVVRIGWQIGTRRGGNQMVDHLEQTHAREGRIAASTAWVQACSFLEDTTEALVYILRSLPGGLYHLDGNPGLSFYEIATALNAWLGHRWKVEPTESPALNNRMIDPRVPVRPITERLRA